MLVWDEGTADKFQQMLAKIPPFMRSIAEDKVSRKAEDLAFQEGRALVNEKDMVDAFFAATPFGFHRPMKEDMKSLGIDFTQYGHK